MPIANHHHVLETEKILLNIAGYYSGSPQSFEWKFLKFTSAVFSSLLSSLQFLFMFIFLCTQVSNLTQVSESLLICLTQLAYLCKLTNFLLRKRYLIQIEITLTSAFFTDLSKAHLQLVDKYTRPVKILANIYRSMCAVVVLFYALFPLLDVGSKTEKKFPLQLWTPYDANSHYYITFLLEILSIAVSAFMNSTIDILPVTLMSVATAHFDILKDKLSNTVNRPEDQNDKRVKNRLRICIKYYIYIERLVLLIEKTFHKGIFIQFFCSVMVICLTGFQMLVISFKSMQFILLIVYFCTMMCQIAMYCWYGHILMDSSDKITEACYMSKWFECSVECQRIFITIMERAKRLVKLRAGNFFTLNLQTLMSILRTSYSYFAVLQHLYSNNKV